MIMERSNAFELSMRPPSPATAAAPPPPGSLPMAGFPAAVAPTPEVPAAVGRLLEELLAIARATQGKADFSLDLSPVGEDFDPLAVV